MALARKLQEEEACRASDLAPFLAKLDLTEHAPSLFRRGIDVAKVKALSPHRGSAAALGPPGSRDYLAAGSGFSATYSAFGGGGLGLFASAPGFITTSSRIIDDSTPPGAPGDTTRRSSP